MMEEKTLTTAEEIAEIIEEINQTNKRIAEALEQMAGSVDKSDGRLCIKGDVVTTCYREF